MEEQVKVYMATITDRNQQTTTQIYREVDEAIEWVEAYVEEGESVWLDNTTWMRCSPMNSFGYGVIVEKDLY